MLDDDLLTRRAAIQNEYRERQTELLKHFLDERASLSGSKRYALYKDYKAKRAALHEWYLDAIIGSYIGPEDNQ